MEKKSNFNTKILCNPSNPLIKIVATHGPATKDDLEEVLQYGMIRINMAFVDKDNMKDKLELIDRVIKNHGDNINIMLDAVGPRVKLCTLPPEGVLLEEGKEIIISTDRSIKPSSEILPTIFKEFAISVKQGEPILLAEGKYRLEIIKVLNEKEVLCKIIHGGLLKKKGINLPKSSLKVPALSDEDVENLTAVLSNDKGRVDTIALSFVRNKTDIEVLQSFLKKINREDVKIMAKIETQEACDKIVEIAKISDSLMVARGDLWCELENSWTLPLVTLDIIKAGNNRGIPVVVATQTLSSMVSNDLPSRAEVDELFFLMINNADCIMGSEEFAIGKYPRNVIKAIHTVGRLIDNNNLSNCSLETSNKRDTIFNLKAQPLATTMWAEIDPNIECIVVISQTGYAFRQIYKQRPKKPIIAITNDHKTARYYQIFKCMPVFVEFNDNDDYGLIAKEGLSCLKKSGWKNSGKRAILYINVFKEGCSDCIRIEEIDIPEN